MLFLCLATPFDLIAQIEVKAQEKELIAKINQAEEKDNETQLLALLKEAQNKPYFNAELLSYLALQKLYLNQNKYSSSLEYSKKAQNLAIQLKDYKKLSSTYTYRSFVNSSIKLYNDAESNLDSAVFYINKLDNKIDVQIELSSISTHYAYLYELQNKQNLVLFYTQNALSILEKINIKSLSDNQKYDYFYYLVYANINLGSYYVYGVSTRDLAKAEPYFLKTEEIIDTLNIDIKDTYSNVFQSIGSFYLEKRDFNKALKFLEKSLKAEESYPNQLSRLSTLKTIQITYDSLGDIAMQNKYLLLISKLETEIYDNRQSTLINSTQTKLKENKNALNKTKSNIYLGSFLVILLLVSISFFIFRYLQKKKNKSLTKKYEALLSKLENKKTNSTLSVPSASNLNSSELNSEKLILEKEDRKISENISNKIEKHNNVKNEHEEDAINALDHGNVIKNSITDLPYSKPLELNKESNEPDTGKQTKEDNKDSLIFPSIERQETVDDKEIEGSDGQIAAAEPENILNIASETEDKLLKKLKSFEDKERFLNPELRLGNLAHQWKTNTKYLSTLIKTHKGLTFPAYINKLRIDYIVEKLYNTPEYLDYKVSFLAKESGYNSTQVFVNAFKKETGLSPSYFIEKIKQDAAR